MTFPIFPVLNPGWSRVKRPKGGSSLVARSGTGRQVRVRLWAYPTWEFDITWEYLPDYEGNGATDSDFRTLLGNFLTEGGAFGPFLYQDPDENTVTATPIGTGDGATESFTLVKTFGVGSFVGTEPIGWLDVTQACNIYVAGVLKTFNVDYTLQLANPYAQLVTFVAAPAKGAAITADLSFFYYVHFKKDVYDFEEFVDALWSQKLITLASLKG
jgi:hypothetical protein